MSVGVRKGNPRSVSDSKRSLVCSTRHRRKATKYRYCKYLDKLQQHLTQALALADDNSKTAQDRYVTNYNKVAKHKEFDIGDQVLVLLPSSTNRLISEWIGPATVVGIVSDYGYRIALNTAAIRILHANN